ncbi:MAG: aldehyde dehydrogenase family protein [Bacteroidetes bacterium]|nr:aldehyde dehydrogenase family protein [Bacteroidota bacterium]
MPLTTTKPKITKPAADPNGLDKRQRLNVQKTYKIYIGGKFPRTESGRYYTLKSETGRPLANICRCSRKDFREAVVAARTAFKDWSGRTAFNRGQILYRMAEMLESRKAQFLAEITWQGAASYQAEKEVNAAIDRLVYYAGWCDKFQQIFSSVNPVNDSYFNFSVPEPTGIVSIIAPEDSSLIGLVSTIAPMIAGGNCCVVLASGSKPLCAVTFAEVLNSSDLPGGVVNILTGYKKELIPHFSTHMDVNAMVYCGGDHKTIQEIQSNATVNVKRVILHKGKDWMSKDAQSPYMIMDAQEIKTTWHPVGI